MNLLGTVIKICSGKPGWLPNKLHIASYIRTKFTVVARQFYFIVNAINQPYMNPLHHFIQSRLLSKLKITRTVKVDNETHDQLTYNCNVSAKPINYMGI